MAKRRQTTGMPRPSSPRKPTETQETERPTGINSVLRRNAQPIREYRSRAERESEIQRLVILGTGIAVALIVVVIAAALILDGVIRPTQTVATVNGETISVADFQQRVRLERALLINRVNNGLNDYIAATGSSLDEASQIINQEPYATWWNELNVPDQLGIRVLEDMVDDRIVLQELQERGLAVSEEDIDARINEVIGYDPDAVAAIGADPTQTPSPSPSPTALVSPTPSPEPTSTPAPTEAATAEAAEEDENDAAAAEPTLSVTAQPTATAQPTLTREEVEETFTTRRTSLLNSLRNDAGVSDGAVREYFRVLAARNVLREALNESEEATGMYVDARHILVNTEEEAADVIAALQAGESFADLARASSIDTQSGAQGGELGFRPVFFYVEPFAEAAETAPIGEVVGPVESEFGFHIIQVRDREMRELTEIEQDALRSRDFNQWLETASAEADSELFSLWIDNVPQTPAFVYRPRS
jgi:parvulin-like peptidyl-prolyl isomerase